MHSFYENKKKGEIWEENSIVDNIGVQSISSKTYIYKRCRL